MMIKLGKLLNISFFQIYKQVFIDKLFLSKLRVFGFHSFPLWSKT